MHIKDDALLALYKQYYEMDNLFLDNLELHAKKLRIDTEEAGQGDWIEVKCNNKVEVRKREKKAVTADRYNFLEDAARRLSDILVLLRAKNYEQRNEVVHHKNQRQHGSFVEKRINGDNT